MNIKLFLIVNLLHLPLALAKEGEMILNLLHYNIKELDSSKILEGIQNEQLDSAQKIIKKFPYDILSINEVQYDLPSVPNSSFKTK